MTTADDRQTVWLLQAPDAFVGSGDVSAFERAAAWLTDIVADGWEPAALVVRAIGERGQPPSAVLLHGAEGSNVLVLVRRASQPMGVTEPTHSASADNPPLAEPPPSEAKSAEPVRPRARKGTTQKPRRLG